MAKSSAVATGGALDSRVCQSHVRPARVRLVIPSDTSYLGVVRDVAQRVARATGFDPDSASQIALAVDEAATNAIVHAYGGADNREVELCFKATATGLFVAVIDSGERLDPRRLPEVDLQRYASEGRKGGLGVHLMGRIMDAVAFRRMAGRNVCSLFKRKSGSLQVGG